MIEVAIIDYGSGNLRSVQKAFERAAREWEVDAAVRLTTVPNEIARADRIVLPGVGAFKACMSGLSSQPGVLEGLQHAALVNGRPFLGICVGMQLLAQEGEEFGLHPGLEWMDGAVRRMTPDAKRVPHMGWNTVDVLAPHPVFSDLDGEGFYFAHSYHLQTNNAAQLLATTDYGGAVTAGVGRDNIVGVQFHPEKSQHAGLRLIGNFLRWEPL